jgi:Cu(I)/Ag(I) efflux system membrane fusion protein
MNKTITYAALVLAGALAGAAVYALLSGSQDNSGTVAAGEKKPLYWVAPMDPNFRRDQPGKSPMGMDLIPVYEEEGGGTIDAPGTIRISPNVVNNFGVVTAQVHTGRLVSQIKTVGYVQYDEDRLVHIHPRVEGWIERLYVKAEGDPVARGAPLYDIYSPNLVNAQEELVLSLNRNNPGLIRAAEDRLRSLQVPATTIRALRESRKVSQTITIYAPQSGVVDNLNVREGFFVQPGTSMMSIGVLDDVWVVGEVFERQASMVKVGDPVVMTLDYLPGQSWRGKVDYVYPTLNLKTRTARIRMRLENTGHQLKPGMFAQLSILEDSGQDRVLAPREAVIRTGSQDRVVLALGEGRFKSVEVQIGRVGERMVEILNGLVEGEMIATSAQFLLDSESSKTSDFKRMSMESDPMPSPVTADEKVWVEATINSVMADHRMVNVTHKAVAEWAWPSMTMDFLVDPSVDMGTLAQGMTLHLQITRKPDRQFRISAVHLPDAAPGAAQDPGQSMQDMNRDKADPDQMDHSQMDHSQMDHSQMDHSQMDHSQMDHSQMDHSQMDQEPVDHSAHQGDGIAESGHD